MEKGRQKNLNIFIILVLGPDMMKHYNLEIKPNEGINIRSVKLSAVLKQYRDNSRGWPCQRIQFFF